MKKNGFTLIELVATMALIAILATVILVNMTGIKSNEESKQSDRFKKNIEEAACAYIDMSTNALNRDACKNNPNASQCIVYLKTLIDDEIALVDGESYDPITNSTAEDLKDTIYVQISWVNNNGYLEKKCEMKRN